MLNIVCLGRNNHEYKSKTHLVLSGRYSELRLKLQVVNKGNFPIVYIVCIGGGGRKVCIGGRGGSREDCV